MHTTTMHLLGIILLAHVVQIQASSGDRKSLRDKPEPMAVDTPEQRTTSAITALQLLHEYRTVQSSIRENGRERHQQQRSEHKDDMEIDDRE